MTATSDQPAVAGASGGSAAERRTELSLLAYLLTGDHMVAEDAVEAALRETVEAARTAGDDADVVLDRCRLAIVRHAVLLADHLDRSTDDDFWRGGAWALQRLPADQRVLVSLSAGLGLADHELARLLGTPIRVVRRGLSAGRAALARHLSLPADDGPGTVDAAVRAVARIHAPHITPSGLTLPTLDLALPGLPEVPAAAPPSVPSSASPSVSPSVSPSEPSSVPERAPAALGIAAAAASGAVVGAAGRVTDEETDEDTHENTDENTDENADERDDGGGTAGAVDPSGASVPARRRVPVLAGIAAATAAAALAVWLVLPGGDSGVTLADAPDPAPTTATMSIAPSQVPAQSPTVASQSATATATAAPTGGRAALETSTARPRAVTTSATKAGATTSSASRRPSSSGTSPSSRTSTSKRPSVSRTRTTTTTTTPSVPPGLMRGSQSGLCFTVPANPAWATRVTLADCTGGTGQEVWPGRGGTLRMAGLCVDDYAWGTAPGTPVIVWGCTGQANQSWTMRSDGTIVSVSARLCVAADGASAGASLSLQRCDGGDGAQVWSRT